MRTHIKAWTLAALLAAAVPWLAAYAGETLPLTRVRGGVVLPVRVAGHGPFPFLLGLPYTFSAVDAGLAGSLGFALQQAPDGSAVVNGVRLETGGRELRRAPRLAADIAPVRRQHGEDVFGIAAAADMPGPFMLDFPEMQCVFIEETHSVQFSIDLAEPGPPLQVDVLINGKHLRKALIDLALAADLALPESFARETHMVTEDTPLLRARVPRAGAAGTVQFRASELRVGPAVMKEPVCALSQEGPARLGLGFLRHWQLAIDLDEGVLGLAQPDSGHVPRPGPASVTSPPVVGCGLTPAYLADGEWVLFVAEPSPAADAGILPGEVLISVDGEPAGELSWTEAADLLDREEGASLPVTVRGEGEPRTVRLAWKRLL